MNKYSLLILTVLLAFTSCQTKQEQLSEKIENSLNESEFNGYLYVEQDMEVLYNNGIQSPTLTLPSLNYETPTFLASLTKLFTEIAVLKLSELGLIDLNAPIATYREDFKPEFGQKLTVLDLLKMKSGLPREISQKETMTFVQYNQNMFAGPFLDTIPDFELSFEPGTKEEYSNLNYWILGSIIEGVTDKNLHDALEQLIFEELKMANSGLMSTEPSLVDGYVFKENQLQVDNSNYQGRYASGGCYSTAEDLVILSKALQGSEFLSPASKDLLTNSTNKIEAYGSLPGYSNMYIQDLDKNYTIIALNNLGLRDLSAMTKLKSGIETSLGFEAVAGSRKKVRLNPVSKLSDAVSIEKSFKAWIEAAETTDATEIFEAINSASVQGSMSEDDRTWEDLSQLNKTLPNFRALGFRWVKDEAPKGIEVWFGSDDEGKLAVRWLLSETDSTRVENLFIMPDDMTWQGNAY